jgi:hypothetical protein
VYVPSSHVKHKPPLSRTYRTEAASYYTAQVYALAHYRERIVVGGNFLGTEPVIQTSFVFYVLTLAPSYPKSDAAQSPLQAVS